MGNLRARTIGFAKITILSVVGLATLCITGASCTAADHSVGLCGSNEEVVFSCEIDRSVLSICSGDLRFASKYAQYRYGTTDGIRMLYPANLVPPAGKMYFSTTSYSGGGEAHLRFDNAEYRYIVFDRTVKGAHGEAEFDSGVVVVEKNRGKKTILRCDDESSAFRAPAYKLFEREIFVPISSSPRK